MVLGGHMRNSKSAYARTVPESLFWELRGQKSDSPVLGYWKGICGTKNRKINCMYCIAICEDDTAQREYEETLIRHWANDRKNNIVLDSYATAEQLLFACEDKPPCDLYILDIQMGQMNGMELAAKLRDQGLDGAILFLTGIPDYAIEGYMVGAVRYLLKPIREEDFLTLLDTLYQARKKDGESCFILKQGNSVRKIKHADILYVEARGHYIHMQTAKGGEEWKDSFSAVKDALFLPGFFLLKRGLIVNLAQVEQISRTECILGNGTSLPVARTKYKELNKAFIDFYQTKKQTGGYPS